MVESKRRGTIANWVRRRTDHGEVNSVVEKVVETEAVKKGNSICGGNSGKNKIGKVQSWSQETRTGSIKGEEGRDWAFALRDCVLDCDKDGVKVGDNVSFINGGGGEGVVGKAAMVEVLLSKGVCCDKVPETAAVVSVSGTLDTENPEDLLQVKQCDKENELGACKTVKPKKGRQKDRSTRLETLLR